MEASQPGRTAMAVTTGGLTRRMLTSVVAAVVAFAVVHRAVLILADDPIVAVVVASGAAIALAALTLRRAVAPIVATQADLQVRYEAALADALADPLTGLGNHRSFHEELDRQVAGALRYEVPLGLLLIDLDEFKAVNDGRGHAGGDRVLRDFGELLGGALRRADRAYRIGGDEFAVILPHTDLEGSRIVARRLLAQALQPSLKPGDMAPASFSGGVSAMPELAVSMTQLYSQADAALYAAKRGGRTEVVVFDAGMPLAPEDMGASSSAVADVIARGQLRPAYQPIVSLATREVMGVEGLIRPVPPAPFADPASLFAAAEASGRLMSLDLACIETIVAGAADLPEEQFLSINLSPATAEAAEFSSGAMSPSSSATTSRRSASSSSSPSARRCTTSPACAAGSKPAVAPASDSPSTMSAPATPACACFRRSASTSSRSISRSCSAAPPTCSRAPCSDRSSSSRSRTGALVVAEGIEHAAQLEPLIDLGITAGQGYFLGRPETLVSPASVPMPAD